MGFFSERLSVSELVLASMDLLIEYFAAPHSPQSKDLQDLFGCSTSRIFTSFLCGGQRSIGIPQKSD